MAPAKPPSSTHQTTASAALKRHHSSRHALQHPQPPEESPTPASSGRANGSPPPARSSSTATIARKDPVPAAPGVAPTAGQAVEGARSTEGLLESSYKLGRPPLSAGNPVSGMLLQTTGSVTSGDLGPIGRRRRVEGIKGFAEPLPGSVSSTPPSNGGLPKSAGIRPEGTPHVFDVMLERAQGSDSVQDVPTKAGEVWEKGPEKVVRVGSSIRAVYSSPSIGETQAVQGSGGSGRAILSNSNAAGTQRPGMSGQPRIPLDALKEDAGGPGLAPDCSGRAGEHSAAFRQAGLPGRAAVLKQLRRDTISSSDDLGGSIEAQCHPNIHGYTPDGAGLEGGSGRTSFEGVKEA